MKRILAIAFAAALCLAIAAPAAAAEQARPFRGSVLGVDSATAPTDCPAGAAWRYTSAGTGEITHLGHVSVVVTHCTWLDSPTTGHAGPGTITFTAANGDTLVFEDVATFHLEMTAGGLISVVDLDWTVIGGTGRFAHATGSGKAAPISDLVAGTTAATFSGTISYDASDVAAH